MSKKKKLLSRDVEDEALSGGTPDTKPLSEEEQKILFAAHKDFDRSTLPNYDNSDLAKAKRYAKKNKLTVGFVIGTVALLLVIIVALSVVLLIQNANAPSTDDFTLTLGEDEQIIKYKSAMRDGTLYLDIVQIARYAELVISGNESSLKISCADGTYVRFEHGESIATVNGEKVKLGGNAEIVPLEADSKEKMQCFIPYEFIERLFSAEVEKGSPSVYVSFSDKTNKILIHRIYYKDSGKPLPISFSVDCFDLIADSLLKVSDKQYLI